jgi:ATP-dependent DNA helicase RecG
MQEFLKGRIQILFSTTVIEVGIDVANATVMVIEHAERFGLSQLHQLRGRIGRGSKKSYCILKSPPDINELSRKRLQLMVRTHDGFEIAEEDLRIRGWGDFFGTRQHGIPSYKLANPLLDRKLLQSARSDAFDLIARDPHLRSDQNNPLREYFMANYKESLKYFNIQ